MSLIRIPLFLFLSAITIFSNSVVADIGGVVATDRFGYAGTTTRYATLADAINQTNPLNTINIVERDLSLFQVSNTPWYYSDSNIIMGSWWYSTDPSGNPGAGNTHGNLGIGLVQVYEDPVGSSGTSITSNSRLMRFQNFNGTFFTDYRLKVAGVNAGPTSSLARFSPFAVNSNDSGVYLNYSLDILATGLQGTLTSPGLIESTNHPTGVSGSFSGLFQNTSSDPLKQGFYNFDLALNMDNWSFANMGSLTYPPDGFADSYFAQAVPEPASGIGLLAISLLCAFRVRTGRGK